MMDRVRIILLLIATLATASATAGHSSGSLLQPFPGSNADNLCEDQQFAIHVPRPGK